MRVLVIGSGSIGRRHHDNLQALGAQSRLLSWREAGLVGAARAMDDAEAVVIATATDPKRWSQRADRLRQSISIRNQFARV